MNPFTSLLFQLIRLCVTWQCKAYSKAGDKTAAEHPNFIVEGEALKRVRKLNVFEPCTNQIGDRYLYTLKENDCIYMKEEWKRLEKDVIRGENGGSLPGLRQSRAAAAKKRNRKLAMARFNKKVRENPESALPVVEKSTDDAQKNSKSRIPYTYL